MNVEGIAKNFDNIVQTIFNNPDDYLYYGAPIAKVELAFNEEIEFHKIMSEEKYNFNRKAYKSTFKEVNDS